MFSYKVGRDTRHNIATVIDMPKIIFQYLDGRLSITLKLEKRKDKIIDCACADEFNINLTSSARCHDKYNNTDLGHYFFKEGCL